jgi:hypothetical protein
VRLATRTPAENARVIAALAAEVAA